MDMTKVERELSTEALTGLPFLKDRLGVPNAPPPALDEIEYDGEIFEIWPGEGEVSLPEFEPGVDTLALRLPTPDTQFAICDASNGGVALRYGDGDAAVTLCLPHLTDLPVEDMEIVLALEAGDIKMPFATVLDSAVGTPTKADPFAGDSVHWIYDEAASMGDTTADIDGFVPGEDSLHVALPHPGRGRPPKLTVEPSFTGADGVVRLAGEVIAILRGAPHASLSDVVISVRSDLFA